MIKSRQILHSQHVLKFGTDASFLVRRALQQSENQIPSWILDNQRFRFTCLPFSSLDDTRCMRIKGKGRDSLLVH